jgi:osmotically inducible protein OsmC
MAIRRNASVTWSGPAREGTGIFRVGSGAITAPYTYNSRFKGNNETNPEELLAAAQAGCLSMALAAALQESRIEPGAIQADAELELVPHESGGYRIPTMQVEMVVSAADLDQGALDAALNHALEMCPVCHALAGVDIRVTARVGAARA